MEFIYTNGTDERFIRLCEALDDSLNEIVGGKKQREQYNTYNTLEAIHDVIVVVHEGIPIACGSFKEYSDRVKGYLLESRIEEKDWEKRL